MAKLRSKDMALLCPSLLTEFVSCVKNTCDTISVDQVEILHLFKTNILAIKSEVDTCLNKLIGRELELKFLKNDCEVEKHVKNGNPSSCSKQPFHTNRIVIHGLSSLKDVRKEEAIKIVNSFFSSTLKVEVKVENVDVLNQKRHPVAIVSLSSIHDRRKIFGNCHRLKFFHERVSVTDDVPPKTRDKRKHLHKTAFVGTDVKNNSEFDMQTVHLRESESEELKISNEKIQCVNEIKAAFKNVARKKHKKKNRVGGKSGNLEEKLGRKSKLRGKYACNLELEKNSGVHMEGIVGGIGKMEGCLGGTENMEGCLGGTVKLEGCLSGTGKMEGCLGGKGKMEGCIGGTGNMEGSLEGIGKMEGNLSRYGQEQGGDWKPEEKSGENCGGKMEEVHECNNKVEKISGKCSEECSEIVYEIEKCLREAVAMWGHSTKIIKRK